MKRTRRAMALVLSCFASMASAQQGELNPEVALSLLVEVRSIELNSQGEPDPLTAAGTILGERNDTLFVVTSEHHVKDSVRVEVRLTPGGPAFPATVLAAAPQEDFAFLAVTGYRADRSWRLPRKVPRTADVFRVREPVFAIGCPEGKCWVSPERGELHSFSELRVNFRAYIKEGASGGPLVDQDGGLLGMVLHTGTYEATAVWWGLIESLARQLDYPMNLPEERGYRVGELAMRFYGAAFPGPGRDLDGSRLFPGLRTEVAYRVAPRVEVAGGISLVSFGAPPFAGAAWDDGYTTGYFHAGARYSMPVTLRSRGRGFPDAVSGGVDVLLPVERVTQVIGMAVSDSVDLARGEYVQARTRFNVSTNLSFAGRTSYRIAFGEQVGVVVAPSIYLLLFDSWKTAHLRGILEVGAEFRGPA